MNGTQVAIIMRYMNTFYMINGYFVYAGAGSHACLPVSQCFLMRESGVVVWWGVMTWMWWAHDLNSLMRWQYINAVQNAYSVASSLWWGVTIMMNEIILLRVDWFDRLHACTTMMWLAQSMNEMRCHNKGMMGRGGEGEQERTKEGCYNLKSFAWLMIIFCLRAAHLIINNFCPFVGSEVVIKHVLCFVVVVWEAVWMCE